ncbi:hypothetical protein M406DRAFT_357423 [Cryphonectria parasitica EP155]|uniref:Uncharacterized protein n=1 Tax=Cryphonectria parasitica (strain ATCC 38755 / EP155) TaxID=660469 RepID=A0A9P4XX03_CRYP1|nr:uncharacterized protein M406DRAFT_357423 [Cryphonectria parasitica EP155]KAF3762357.1 hypothetical protein M406DRAFT_357423 [Cryphonectria parasitica EP155]
MTGPEVSHGRGGAGNITPDDTKYADAEIVRTADEGTGVSTGRGGAANIIGKNAAEPRQDKEVVPEEAIKPSMENQDYHVGRGGAGNEHHAPGHDHKDKQVAAGEEGATTASAGRKGLADKLKAKITGIFKK